ncbi:MAG: helix-turn-helix transcriptional regulator [Bacteroidota bacterium]
MARGDDHGCFLASLRLEHFTTEDLAYLGLGRARRTPDPRVYLDEDSAAVLFSMAKRALHHARTNHHDDIVLLPAYVRTMILEIGGHLLIPTRSRLSAADRLAAEFERIVDETVTEALQIRDYALRLGVSPSHLSDTVRSAMGVRPLDVVNARRSLEARRLLIHTSLSVAEVGFQLGYSSASHFGRWFRKQVGTSPGQFRLGFSPD